MIQYVFSGFECCSREFPRNFFLRGVGFVKTTRLPASIRSVCDAKSLLPVSKKAGTVGGHGAGPQSE